MVTVLLLSITQQLKSSLIPSLKKETLKSLPALNSHIAFFCAYRGSTLTKLQLLCIVLLLSQLESTFWGTIIQHQSQIHNSVSFINPFQIHNFPLDLSSSRSPYIYQYRAIVSDSHIYTCNMRKCGFSPYKSANSCLNPPEFRRG